MRSLTSRERRSLTAMPAALLAYWLTLATSAWGAPPRLVTPDHIVSMRTTQSVALSPDGETIAYVVNEPMPEERSKEVSNADIWLLSVKGGKPKRCVADSAADTSPQWSPDGSKIAFYSQRGDDRGRQIYVMDAKCGNQRRLTNHETSLASFAWSPDGRQIAYLATAPLNSEQKERERIGDDEMVFSVSDSERHHAPQKLWMVDSANGAVKQVPSGPGHLSSLSWSPDGRNLLVSVAPENNMDAERIGSQLAVLAVSGGEPRVYCPHRGTYTRAHWLPDGSGISFLGASAGGREPAASSLYVCTGEGSTPVNLTEGMPFTVAGYQWLPDGKSALLTVIEKNSRYLVRLDKANRQISRISDAGQIVSADVSLSRDSKTAACVIETPNQPPDIFIGPMAGPFRRMTRLNPALEELTYGETEDVAWKASDGLEITGVLIKPVGYQASQRYPLIVQVHGGPENADLNGFQIAWGQFFAAHGYAVLFPNFRGSIGRGVEYTLQGNRDFGGKDFQDIMAGVDELIRLGIADPDRLGIGGWSYGGFMSAWAPTQTNRFKASVMGVGVSNWYSLMGQTPLPLWTVQVHFETWPSDQPEAFRRPSPIEFVKNVKTPILILHGENDPMIALSQAREYFRALRHLDAPVEMVVYPREGHGLREPVHRKRAYARILAWYDRYVKNALPADKGKTAENR